MQMNLKKNILKLTLIDKIKDCKKIKIKYYKIFNTDLIFLFNLFPVYNIESPFKSYERVFES